MATSGDVCFLRVKEVRVRGAAPEGTRCSQSSLVFKVKENTSTPEMSRNYGFCSCIVFELVEEERRSTSKSFFPPREDVFTI